MRRKRPLHNKFAHALHSSAHEREMILGRTRKHDLPDVPATSRAYVAGLEPHKMEEWRTNGKWSKFGGKFNDQPTLLIPG